MNSPKLFMLLIGCKPKGRHTEQHDVFFGIAEHTKELIPHLHQFWPEAEGKMHIDAWREVTAVNGYTVRIIPMEQSLNGEAKLFFINLGGYKKDEFEEFHYKMIVASPEKAAAIQFAKQSAFYQHTGFDDAPSHVDDKYGVDVDDVYEIDDILSPTFKQTWKVVLQKTIQPVTEDKLHLGYFKLSSFV
ncbi:MAG TPA: DUF1543 domain-containing protein [Lacibacter sp.]|nr:DUF1543 domain-containing protein [Lacibacter sp.]